jgi:hypothetical protein
LCITIQVVKGGIFRLKKTSRKITLVLTLSIFLVLTAISANCNGIALAQTFEPPQIPNYGTSDDNSKLDIQIPSEPNNPGLPQNLPPANPTPQPPMEAGLMFFIAIIIGVPVIGLLVIWVAWAMNKRKKTLP